MASKLFTGAAVPTILIACALGSPAQTPPPTPLAPDAPAAIAAAESGADSPEKLALAKQLMEQMHLQSMMNVLGQAFSRIRAPAGGDAQATARS